MNYTNILGASVSMLLASSAIAAESSSDLVVKGSITPGAACSLAVPASLNLGTIHRDELNPDPSKPTELEQQEVDIQVTCPEPRRLAFVVREAGGQDASNAQIFPIHSNQGEQQVGDLYLKFISHATLIDGSTKGYATAADRENDLGQATWGPSTPHTENLPIRNGLFAVGFVTHANSTEAPGNIDALVARVMVKPWIKPAKDLDLTAEIGFSSDLGLEISYF